VADAFWKSEPGWVLLRSDDGLLPINERTRMAWVIEDEEESNRVV
jgi:hypothetical protein